MDDRKAFDALMSAARSGNVGSTRDMLGSEATAAHIAVLDDAPDQIALPVNCTARGVTPLHLAALLGRVKCADALIAAGAEVRTRTALDPHSATMMAAYSTQEGSADVMRALVRAGADLNERGEESGLTLLLAACAAVDAGKIQALLEAGAPVVSAVTEGKRTLLTTGVRVEGRYIVMNTTSVFDKTSSECHTVTATRMARCTRATSSLGTVARSCSCCALYSKISRGASRNNHFSSRFMYVLKPYVSYSAGPVIRKRSGGKLLSRSLPRALLVRMRFIFARSALGRGMGRACPPPGKHIVSTLRAHIFGRSPRLRLGGAVHERTKRDDELFLVFADCGSDDEPPQNEKHWSRHAGHFGKEPLPVCVILTVPQNPADTPHPLSWNEHVHTSTRGCQAISPGSVLGLDFGQ